MILDIIQCKSIIVNRMYRQLLIYLPVDQKGEKTGPTYFSPT